MIDVFPFLLLPVWFTSGCLLLWVMRPTFRYDFPGAQQGELSTTAGEVLDMLEDDGSGWVLAGRRDGSGRQGFVPATYIQKM